MNINPQDPKYTVAFQRLLKIMNELREQCPWDRKQTMESLRHLSIEEVYELSDAILEGELTEVKKELGDILLHIVFYAKIGAEQDAFDIADVLHGVCEKLIARHPHIYGDVKVESEKEVRQNWEQLKLKEKKNATVLGGVPKSLPALLKAYRIQEKASGVGFDWNDRQLVWDKVQEEIGEFQEAEAEAKVNPEAQAHAEEEFGDMLFSLINYARFANINPETALEKANQKFVRRFNFVEQSVKDSGKGFEGHDLESLEAFWVEAKNNE